ncbi:MAG: META domain-containing protein [Lautropia sp.]|nr:META domain-containing protein [Lautropia sp.]
MPGLSTKARAAALEGTEWRLSALSGIAGIRSEGKPSLTMRSDGGQFGGYAGCNSYFGSYTRDGEQVKFSVSGMTKRMCDIAGMKQEGAFLGMLRGAARLSVQGGELHVFDQKGAELARFVPADSPAD